MTSTEDRPAGPGSGLPRPVKITLWLVVVAAVLADFVLLTRYARYRDETARLREGMTEAQRQRTDAVVEAERHRFRVEMELIRRQSAGDRELHLAVNIDSGRMVLERDGVALREMEASIGPDRFQAGMTDSTIRVAALGQRTVNRVLGKDDPWEVPESVFHDRGLPIPAARSVPGALGAHAIVLGDGTVIYSIPTAGPLADSSYVLPGSVRVAEADLKAIAASIRPGMSVYFYR